MKKGFTLIELLVFLAIFSTVIVAFVAIFIAMINIQTSQTAATEVNQQGQFLIQQIQYDISSARLVDMVQDVATGTLVLREFSSAQDPLSIAMAGTSLSVQQGARNAWQAITSNKVSISNVAFTRHFNLNNSDSAFGTDSVDFSFTLSATSTNGTAYSRNFQSSASVFAPVGKIVMIQQGSFVDDSPAASALDAIYSTPNASGSLLIAVTENATTSASVNISDYEHNTWNLIGSISYPAYNTKLTLWDALDAKGGSNIVTAFFGSGAGYASLFVYEYRGASTSSSFDAWASQLQSNTTSPSSGSANATSAVELVFGVTYNGVTTEVPSAETGFVMETSSTAPAVFVEDTTQYITGPVAATWQYTGVTSSSALVATFQ